MHIACAQHAHSSATQPVPHASIRAYHSRTCRPTYVLTYLRTHTRTYLLIRTRSQYLLTHLLTYRGICLHYKADDTKRHVREQLPVLLTHSPITILTYRGINLHYKAGDTKRHVREQLPVVVELRGQLRL